jgi:hypothetical protein
MFAPHRPRSDHVKKIVVLSGGLVVAGSAALIGAGVALSQPATDNSSYNVVGEPYNKALQILKSEGIKAYFGGSFGSVLPQAQCLVDQQKVTAAHRMLLMLDCSQKAADILANMGPSGGPTVGSNGVTTVTPTPVVPIQGAPGAGTPPG